MADPILQEIKDRLDVVDLLSSYIQLKRSGANFKATCPFHNEKTASLMVSPAKQIWHCFGCGEGGDVFGFVMRYENVEFKEALKILANRAGISLPEYHPPDPKQQTDKELAMRINAFASKFYHEYLLKNSGAKPAREYLRKRGLNKKTIEQWGIGYAPNGFHALEQALGKKGVQKQDLIKAGVSVKNDKGQIYDRFRDRIMFSIFDYFGNVVGFSARTLSAEPAIAKYINSPETTIYNKSRILFGLHTAKNEIRKLDEVIIVEGQMDCIQAHQAGFKNTVATSGTALTEQHLEFLGRLTRNIKFCFDADTAGNAASRRAGEMALKLGFNVKMISFTGAKDPDELILKNPAAWQRAVSEASWLVQFYIQDAFAKYPSQIVEQKKYVSQNILPLLPFIQDPIEKDHYFRQLAQDFGIRESVIRGAVQGSVRQTSANQDQTPVSKVAEEVSTLEKEIIGGMLKFNQYKEFILVRGETQDFVSTLARECFASATDPQALAVFGKTTLAKEAQFMVEFELALFENNEEFLLSELKKSFYRLKIASIKRQNESIAFSLKRAERQNQAEEVKALREKFAQLSNLLLEYEKEK